MSWGPTGPETVRFPSEPRASILTVFGEGAPAVLLGARLSEPVGP